MEQVKSVILLLLIFLSLTLTFTIWTYSPTYGTNETPIVDISIAEKKKIEDVVKPYRLLYSHEEMFTGSNSKVNIETVLNSMKTWEIQAVEPLNNKASYEQINDYIKTPNRITLFYSAEVPIKTYSSILSFASYDLPNASFNRLVIDWNDPLEDKVTFYFINTIKQKVYTARVDNVNREGLSARTTKKSINLPIYNEIERPGRLSLYVSKDPESIIGYTYILEEIDKEKFINALFTSPNLVRSNPLGISQQEYTDDSALMNVDFLSKKLLYVHPASESEDASNPGELIQNSVNFINEHNGWTDDYRYSRINPATQQVSYQLYLDGIPVFSDDTWTEMTTYWGVNRIYRYTRPYFTLNVSNPIKSGDIQLVSGQDTFDLISTFSDISMLSVDDIAVGYYLSQDDQQLSMSLEPSWYYLLNGSWTRVSPEILGGGKFGLE